MTELHAADALVTDARRAVHESLIHLAAPEADRVRSLIADLETAVEGRTAIRLAQPVAPSAPAGQGLRDRIAQALLTARRTDYEGVADHSKHRYDARCALCAYDVDALADAVLAVLPAPADQAAEIEHLRKERDGFRDQRNAVFATNEKLLAQVQESDQARLRAENDARTAKREAAAEAADRAAALREAADICDEAGAAYTSQALNDHAGAAFSLMETFRRKANEAEYVATPCSPGGCEPGDPCTMHERLMAHGEGDHELCGPDCGPVRLADEAQRADCNCYPAPLSHGDGTYSHYLGCPIADAQQAADMAQQAGEGEPEALAPEVVAICGSTRFMDEMIASDRALTWAGKIVVKPGCNMKAADPLWADDAEAEAGKVRLDALHRAKIRMADQVLVVGDYIGESTRAEIAYARELGKPVKFTHPDVDPARGAAA